MKIAILGAGRMGSLIGGFATKGGAECYMVDPWQDHVDAINNNGLVVYNNDDEPFTVPCKAYTKADQIGEKMDFIIVLVMGSKTREAVEAAMCLADENTYCLTLQNGLGNVEVIEEFFPKEKICYGFVPYGGTVMGPGKVKTLVSPTAESYFASAVYEEPTDKMKEFAQIMCSTGLSFTADKKSHVDSEIWFKISKNCAGNAVCGICRLPLGPFFNNEAAHSIENTLLYEVYAVAAAQGIHVAKYDMAKGLPETNPMYLHLPSTAQDMKAKRITEIDNLNGAVARLGDKYGIPTPYNHMITAMVKLIEQNYDLQY